MSHDGRAPVAGPAPTRALRAIAAFEAFKGAAALAASLGLLSLLHHDVHAVVATLIGHFGLRPGDRYPSLLLRYADLIADQDRRNLVLLASGYVALRFVEAYGLWMHRGWGPWLGALSGGLYVPFEVWHLAHRPGLLGGAVLAGNLLIVVLLARQVSRDEKARRASAAG